jgi:hypothetical protein
MYLQPSVGKENKKRLAASTKYEELLWNHPKAHVLNALRHHLIFILSQNICSVIQEYHVDNTQILALLVQTGIISMMVWFRMEKITSERSKTWL